ncbi:RICIN domain-containing protein [Streptomyces sp. NPDC051976]|uniref:RICIN domain-containing protein n=1 Tax=Streptomyces sp. NPDC051976 TaxID=3154947 RepID=UPI003412C992
MRRQPYSRPLKTHAKAIALCAGIPALIRSAGGVANASTINYSVLYNFNTDNQCLAVASGSINNGTGVIQWDFTNGTEQLWSFDYLATKTFNGSTWYHLVNYNSSGKRGTPMCLAVPGGTSALNTQLSPAATGTTTGGGRSRPQRQHLRAGERQRHVHRSRGQQPCPRRPRGVQWSCDNGPERSWYLP